MPAIWQGTIDVASHFFELLDESSSNLTSDSSWGPNHLVQTTGWGVAVTTGVSDGPVEVAIFIGVEPDMDAKFEESEDGAIDIGSDHLVLQSWNESKPVPLPQSARGRMRVRVDSRGRGLAQDEVVGVPVEFYQLTLLAEHGGDA